METIAINPFHLIFLSVLGIQKSDLILVEELSKYLFAMSPPSQAFFFLFASSAPTAMSDTQSK